MRRPVLASAVALALGGGLLVGPATPAVAQTDEPCLQIQPLIEGSGNALIDRLGLERAWQHTRGDGATVAVIDSGVDGDNVHLQGAIAGAWCTFRPTAEQLKSDNPQEDLLGHGTAAAGIIAARPVDGSDVVGIAPEADVLAIRAFQTDDTENDRAVGPTTRAIADAIRVAADRGADIISLSLSQPLPDASMQNAIAYARARGALVVASAGNRATSDDDPAQPRYPAAYDGVLGVSALTADGQWDPAASFVGGTVDVVAPGQGLLAPWCGGGDTVLGEQVSSSWATAVVSGIAALVAAAHPDETPDQWAHRIMATALRTTPGERKDTIGWGEARPYEALVFIDDGSAPGPESPTHDRPTDLVVDAEAVRIEPPRDPLAATRATVAWTLLGSVVVSLTALVIGSLRRSGVRRRIR